mgnify:FL=1
MRILSVDWGEARIGLALSDPTGTLASPLTTLHEKDKRAQIERVVEVAKTQEVERIIVGIPYTLDGQEGSMARWARKYAEKLERVGGIEVVGVDERYTSVAADFALEAADGGRRRGRDKGDRDSAAAAILLQEYLDGGGAQT